MEQKGRRKLAQAQQANERKQPFLGIPGSPIDTRPGSIIAHGSTHFGVTKGCRRKLTANVFVACLWSFRPCLSVSYPRAMLIKANQCPASTKVTPRHFKSYRNGNRQTELRVTPCIGSRH